MTAPLDPAAIGTIAVALDDSADRGDDDRTDAVRSYRLEVLEPAGLHLRAASEKVELQPGETITEPLHVMAPRSAFTNGRVDAKLRVLDDEGWHEETTWRLLGPSGKGHGDDHKESDDHEKSDDHKDSDDHKKSDDHE